MNAITPRFGKYTIMHLGVISLVTLMLEGTYYYNHFFKMDILRVISYVVYEPYGVYELIC